MNKEMLFSESIRPASRISSVDSNWNEYTLRAKMVELLSLADSKVRAHATVTDKVNIPTVEIFEKHWEVVGETGPLFTSDQELDESTHKNGLRIHRCVDKGSKKEHGLQRTYQAGKLLCVETKK